MSSKKVKHKADLKVVILGEKSVGKTCLIHRYLDRKFSDTKSTIGASFLLKLWQGYNIAIWDTAGEERFTGLSTFYCRGAGAAILAFDPRDERSFDLLKQRFIPLLDSAEEDCLKILVGTKSDLIDDKNRKISCEEGASFARSLNPGLKGEAYFETSSLSGSNVDEVFEFIFERVFSGRKKNPPKHKEETLMLTKENHNRTERKHHKCCE